MISETASNSKLAAAAEELVKAASCHVESVSLSIGKEAVEELKKLSIESSVSAKSVEELKASMDSKLNTLNQNISNLKEEMVKMNRAADIQAKNQKLEWAIANADIGSFNYYEKDNYNPLYSSDLVREILFSFRRGVGRFINDCSTTPYNCGNVEEGEKKFREDLSKQLHDLIGHKPQISLANKAFVIHYS